MSWKEVEVDGGGKAMFDSLWNRLAIWLNSRELVIFKNEFTGKREILLTSHFTFFPFQRQRQRQRQWQPYRPTPWPFPRNPPSSSPSRSILKAMVMRIMHRGVCWRWRILVPPRRVWLLRWEGWGCCVIVAIAVDEIIDSMGWYDVVNSFGGLMTC